MFFNYTGDEGEGIELLWTTPENFEKDIPTLFIVAAPTSKQLGFQTRTFNFKDFPEYRANLFEVNFKGYETLSRYFYFNQAFFSLYTGGFVDANN